MFSSIHLRAISQWVPKLIVCIKFEHCVFKIIGNTELSIIKKKCISMLARGKKPRSTVRILSPGLCGCSLQWFQCVILIPAQVAKFTGPTWGPPVACRPQMGSMFAPWTLLSGSLMVAVFSISCDISPGWLPQDPNDHQFYNNVYMNLLSIKTLHFVHRPQHVYEIYLSFLTVIVIIWLIIQTAVGKRFKNNRHHLIRTVWSGNDFW